MPDTHQTNDGTSTLSTAPSADIDLSVITFDPGYAHPLPTNAASQGLLDLLDLIQTAPSSTHATSVDLDVVKTAMQGWFASQKLLTDGHLRVCEGLSAQEENTRHTQAYAMIRRVVRPTIPPAKGDADAMAGDTASVFKTTMPSEQDAIDCANEHHKAAVDADERFFAIMQSLKNTKIRSEINFDVYGSWYVSDDGVDKLRSTEDSARIVDEDAERLRRLHKAITNLENYVAGTRVNVSTNQGTDRFKTDDTDPPEADVTKMTPEDVIRSIQTNNATLLGLEARMSGLELHFQEDPEASEDRDQA
jgi:hypothetical protein